MWNWKRLVLLLALTWQGAVHADSSELLGAKELTQRLRGYETFQAEFIQYVVDKSGNRIQETRGELKAKRPGNFYWHIAPPLEQIVVANQKNIVVYDPDLEQATVHPVGKTLGNTPALLLSGNVEKLSQEYKVEGTAWEGDVEYYVLRPKSNESLFETLWLRFEKGSLIEMRLTDALGQKSTLSFISVKLNDALSDAIFNFTPPPGTDVIDDGLN
ncbi:MAG: outer membrane lipoprotein chaperone LolA [Hahellaceae bacterium]|nr:outer membrane lipoprotein chaperone LolA [Hahellaceae bacterium]